jgi:hypothetical protein
MTTSQNWEGGKNNTVKKKNLWRWISNAFLPWKDIHQEFDKPTYLPTNLRTNLPTYLFTYRSRLLRTYLHIYPPTYRLGPTYHLSTYRCLCGGFAVVVATAAAAFSSTSGSSGGGGGDDAADGETECVPLEETLEVSTLFCSLYHARCMCVCRLKCCSSPRCLPLCVCTSPFLRLPSVRPATLQRTADVYLRACLLLPSLLVGGRVFFGYSIFFSSAYFAWPHCLGLLTFGP